MGWSSWPLTTTSTRTVGWCGGWGGVETGRLAASVRRGVATSVRSEQSAHDGSPSDVPRGHSGLDDGCGRQVQCDLLGRG